MVAGTQTEKMTVPIWEKHLLTIDEAALYTNIGQNRIAEMLRKPTCPFVIYVGRKKLVKRTAFEKFLENNIEIE
jgi:excisionase family DNA binding protein